MRGCFSVVDSLTLDPSMEADTTLAGRHSYETDTGFGAISCCVSACRRDYQPARPNTVTSSRISSTNPTSFSYDSAGDNITVSYRWVRFASFEFVAPLSS